MRTMMWVGAAVVGALAGGGAAALFPAAQISQMTRSVGNDLSGFNLADLNPIRAAYDKVKAKIQTGMTPEELGLKTSPPMNLTMPDWKNMSGLGQPLLGSQSRWTTNAIANYPSAWRTPSR
jgi:hypothetical protein